MAYARRLDSGKWLGVYRDPSGKKRYTVAMARKRDALRGAQEQERRVRTGHWTDPAAATVTVREWSERWLSMQTVSARTVPIGVRSSTRSCCPGGVTWSWGRSPPGMCARGCPP
jgi:hypothetical protein